MSICCFRVVVFFFFKQKTAYEMRISDWSSDVCSSDLRGGPAKIAVLTSALFGSISGSSVANVVTTGSFTIPLMKRTGFRPHDAGAIEAIASTGGPFMPPVMGAGVFILATLPETRSEELRIGKEGVRQGRFRWAPSH